MQGMHDEIRALAKKVEDGDTDSQEKLIVLADDGDVQAMVSLGVLFDEIGPVNIKTDLERTLYWYKKAAEAGDAWAQMALANMYHRGQACEIDLNLAFKWYLAAAEQGEVESQMHVARFFQLGWTGEPDLDSARFWYKQAVDNGHELAATNLGIIIYGAAQNDDDYQEAFELFSFAADKGDGLAHLYLGEVHGRGQGVEVHGGKALLHYFIAEALLPSGDNREQATKLKEWMLKQHPELNDEFMERTNSYLEGKGFSRFQ